MNPKLFLITAALLSLAPQSYAQRLLQPLSRGVVAVHRGTERSVTSGTEGNLISWRRLIQDDDSVVYHVYINGSLATQTRNTCYVPAQLNDGDVVRVVPALNGVEDSSTAGTFTYNVKRQPYSNSFMDFDFEGKICDADNYTAKYVWPVDVDGDGEMEFIVAQLSHDHTQHADKVQAYRADGTYLWTVDMGPNVWICGGQNDMVTAYDINCDGKAEVIIRSSDGTCFSDGKYVFGKTSADVDGDGISNYLTETKRNPPFYISIIDGETGKELTSAELDYSKVTDGVDHYRRDNRADYKNDNMYTEYASLGGHFAIIYGDGVHPMLMAECLDRTNDGTHHNYVFGFGYDWTGGNPHNFSNTFTWSRNDKTPWPAEFHQLRVCDVDGDGIDEMLQGGFGVNPQKAMVFSAGIGHGDRFRVGDLDPDRPGLETYAIQQSALLGQLVYDAATGKHLKEWYLPTVTDVGRGECMDVDSLHRGYEIFSTMSNLYDIHGNVIQSGDTPFPTEGLWWDGTLDREMLSSPGGSNFQTNAMIQKYSGKRLAEFSQESNWTTFCGTAIRPAFFGDITGDWREEVIMLKKPGGKNTGLVGYSTNIPTPYSMYCLQQDPHYRLDCTTRGYYQSPNTDFYLGFGMPQPPLPPVVTTDLRWKDGTTWQEGTTMSSFDLTSTEGFSNGKSVLFDISGNASAPIALNSEVKPSATYIMAPIGTHYIISGTGSIGGTGDIWKSERGSAEINAGITTSGRTIISDGVLTVNGNIKGNVDLRAKGTLKGNTTVNAFNFEGALNYEGCRLMPADSIVARQSINFNRPVYIETSLNNHKAAWVGSKADINIADTLTFTIDADSMDAQLLAGTYTLLHADKQLTGNSGLIKFRHLDGMNYDIAFTQHDLLLTIHNTRAAGKGVTWHGDASAVWDYKNKNFNLNGSATAFVQNDEVLFNDSSTVRSITVNDNIVQHGVTFNFNEGTYTLQGSGAIAGDGSLIKDGNGEVLLNLDHNTYTGATIIKGGTLTIRNLANAGTSSSIGEATADASNLQLCGGTLKINADNMSTDRNIEVTDTGTVYVARTNSSLSLLGKIQGSGTFVKDGIGQLNITYSGVNPVGGVILRRGRIAQGAWNASFGTAPMLIDGRGTSFQLLANNNMNTIPTFNNKVTVPQNNDVTILGSFRSSIAGSFYGDGNVTISSGGARCDISSNFANFNGVLTLTGSEARLMSNVTNMRNLTLHPDGSINVQHYKGGSKSTTTAPLYIGALEDASDQPLGTPQLGSSGETYYVGYLNTDNTFSGLLNTSTVVKEGTGTWTLKGTGSTTNLTVNGGTLYVYRGTSAVTKGTITVNAADTLRLNGVATNVTLNKGGVLTAGINSRAYGTATLDGNLNGNHSVLLFKMRSVRGIDKLKVAGTVRLNGDTLRIKPIADVNVQVGDVVTLFSQSVPATGSTWVIDSEGLTWDDSKLTVDGTLTCTGTTGIGAVTVDKKSQVFTTGGIQLQKGNTQALPEGVYIINGKKVVVKK